MKDLVLFILLSMSIDLFTTLCNLFLGQSLVRAVAIGVAIIDDKRDDDARIV